MSRKVIATQPGKDFIARVVTFSILFLAVTFLIDAPKAVSRPVEPASDAGLLDAYRHGK